MPNARPFGRYNHNQTTSMGRQRRQNGGGRQLAIQISRLIELKFAVGA